jgi:hypothetical protein
LSEQLFDNDDTDEWLSEETSSISRKDLFGDQIHGRSFEWERRNYDDATDNPFSCFLRELVAPLGRVAEFHRWYPSDSPRYQVCADEAASLVGNDAQRADEILRGAVALHEMPKEIRGNEHVDARADWVRAQAQQYLASLDEELFGRFGFKLGQQT